MALDKCDPCDCLWAPDELTFWDKVLRILCRAVSGDAPIVVADEAMQPATAAAETAVGDDTADGVLFAANANRKGLFLWNNSSNTAYVRLGTNAATTSLFTFRLGPDGEFHFPFNYQGAAHVIWDGDSVGGVMLVTELT